MLLICNGAVLLFILQLSSLGTADNSTKFVRVPTRKLHNGDRIPALALGTWLGHRDEKSSATPEDVQRAVEHAIDVGYRHIDTAWIYGTETAVGKAVASRLNSSKLTREDLFITTKLWNEVRKTEDVEPALRASLKNLQLDYVDLYLIHWPVGLYANGSFDNTDYLETWAGMRDVLAQNLTRAIGVSNFNLDMLRRMRSEGVYLPHVLQVEVNLNLQQPELHRYCEDNDIVVMGFTPFGSLLPSKAKPDAPPPRIDDPTLVSMAKKYEKTVPQVVLRYLYELGVIPLPKSLHNNRIEENVDIFDFSLMPADKEYLRSLDRGYRTLPQAKWRKHIYYPFRTANDTGYLFS